MRMLVPALGGLLALSGCDDLGPDDVSSSPSLVEGGAEEFGQYRTILEAGEIPGTETLDAVEFFTQHEVVWPASGCDGALCIRAQFGARQSAVSETGCPVTMLGLSTALDIDTDHRPPLNLAFAIDTSASMQGQQLDEVRAALSDVVAELEPEDRVTLVGFGTQARVLAEHVAGEDPEFAAGLDALEAAGKTNVYDGLRLAFQAVERNATEATQNRVVLLSDGMATVGITSDARIIGLVSSFAARGRSLATVGVGGGFDVALMRTLAETGSGGFHFVEDPGSVAAAFSTEVRAVVRSVAQDVHISITAGSGFSLGGVYGTRLATTAPDATSIVLPNVAVTYQVGQPGPPRLGSGRALIAEIVAQAVEHGVDGRHVATIELGHRAAGSEDRIREIVEVRAPYRPDELPEDGYFEGDTVEKGAVMHGVLIAFQTASARATYGDDAGALDVLLDLEASVDEWLGRNDDADIAADLSYVELFIANLRARDS